MQLRSGPLSPGLVNVSLPEAAVDRVLRLASTPNTVRRPGGFFVNVGAFLSSEVAL